MREFLWEMAAIFVMVVMVAALQMGFERYWRRRFGDGEQDQ